MDDFLVRRDRAFELLGPESDAVIIVPPFADIYRPSLGVHLLQAAAEQAGLRVRVLYANLLFATLSGEELYKAISNGNYGWLWGERIFARAAFGLPPLGYQTEKLREQIAKRGPSKKQEVTFEQLTALEREVGPFCSALCESFSYHRFHVAGATTTFHQTTAAVALLAQIKRAKPEAITVIGGANCEGEMARGIASLNAPIDYIFSGECESVFPDFLRRAVGGESLPSDRIVRGEPCFDMDSLPEPCFEDYFAQLDNALPAWREKNEIWLPYETSRGCWWGARQHCTFCGLNGETMAFRQKSPDRAIAGAKRLLSQYPSPHLGMIDNILPHSYFRTVLPRLADELPPARIFYETKSNLSLEQVLLLYRAGVYRIQPGIEALSSSLLRRMKKGVLARQNLALLRHARAAGLVLNWNLLCEFPGDQREDYVATLALLPLIHHLIPPSGLSPVSIDRFSPYYRDAATYGITHLEPLPAYAWAFPPDADMRSLAYHFKGEYACAQSAHPELKGLLDRAVREWRDSWKAGAPPPALSLTSGGDGYFTLMDTRGVEGTDLFQFLSEEEARTVLIGGPLERQPLAAWAIERKLGVALDGWCVPLAVTNVETWRRFEAGIPQSVEQALPAAV
ncbi:MAG: RiPP maturation radical SAM C-methyltransferase [Terriglobia bacterium]